MKRCNEKRTCEVCKNEYIAKVITGRFCSLKCMYNWRSELPRTTKQKEAQRNKSAKMQQIRMCSVCNTSFTTKPSSSKQMCSRKCMYEWRKATNWETVDCIGCGNSFNRRKNEKHHRTGLPTQYCSSKCSAASSQKKEKLRKWGLSEKNHWYNPEVQEKVKKTKKERYGDENYNNLSLNKETCMKRYGIPYAIIIQPTAQGKRTSKPQIKEYEDIKKKYPDALLEHWLPDAQRSVDIYIPSENKIVEIYGTYWHCDPRKYNETYFNKSVKLTAREIWDRDEKRKKFLESLGYFVDVVWEMDIK